MSIHFGGAATDFWWGGQVTEIWWGGEKVWQRQRKVHASSATVSGNKGWSRASITGDTSIINLPPADSLAISFPVAVTCDRSVLRYPEATTIHAGNTISAGRQVRPTQHVVSGTVHTFTEII